MVPKRREEKQRAVHSALLNILYPPPRSPSSDRDKHQLPDEIPELFRSDDRLYDYSGSSSSKEDEVECEQQKLTRAQRKRLRRKKLKEKVLQRRKIVGPLLPLHTSVGGGYTDCGGEFTEDGTTSVRCNASVEIIEESGCINSNKLKLRRKAKRQGKERGKSSCKDT